MKNGKEGKKRKCYNCKYAGHQFKVDKLTHLHCGSPRYDAEFKKTGNVSPWETLRVFSATCSDHEFKT